MKFGTLQVFPRQGVLKEHGLELPTAVIGRGEGAGILIDDFSISRRHARLTVESSKLLVEDLGSVGGTFVNGERLEPGVRHLVEADAVLRFGEIEARFVPPGAAETVTAGGIAEPLEDATFGVSGLSIALAAPGHAIEPGRSADATVLVVNRGRIVDHVRIEIPDLPADWYTIDTPSFPVLPGGRADVKVTLHPPRRHDAAAGLYEFTVRVRTSEYEEHAEVPGSMEVLPFESATLEFEAIRSKKNFRLVAENSGNHLARYELSGRDEEQAFKYEFESPAVELQPGEKRILDLAVRRKRHLFGFPTQPPFEVVGRNETGAEITARGQLSINPPLQRFKMPVAMALVLALLVVTALAIFVIADDNGTQTASAEDPYAGVHLCEDKDAKAEQAKRNADAANDKPLAGATVVGPYDGGRPIFGQVDSTGAPFFAQSDPRWGGDEYARSSELPNGRDWCGTTIEQCGCAMTSVAVMLALYDLVQMPGGEALSPQSLNNWFNGAARQTDRGWVSRGYIYGDVIWSAANELSGEIAKVNPSARTLRFARTGSGSVEEIRADLELGRPVVVEVPGHWIAAVGLEGDEILINDPFYRDRKTLSAYEGKVRSSVHFEPSSDLSSVVITAPADVKFKITDKEGRVVNTGLGTIDQPTDQLNQIPGASLSQKHAWRDPTCIETAPPPDAGTNQVVLPGSRDDYTIEIIGTGGQAASVAIHTYGKDGTSSIATIEGVEGTRADLQFDPNAEKPVITLQNGGGNGTPAASTPTPNAGGAGGGDDETPTASPSPLPPPTATQTPFIEQRTAMTLPAEAGQSRVEVATNSGFELGDPIRFAPGLPNQEDNLIVGFGSFILATPLQFSHGPGEPILRLQRPPGQGPGLPPGVTPPPSTGPLLPPEQVVMSCSTIYQASPKLATFICDVQVVGDFTTTRWTINGQVVTEFSGSTSFVMTFPGDTPASISATVCNVTLCRSTSRNENVQFPPGGSGTSSGGTSGGVSGAGSGAAPTPPPGGAVAINCATEFPVTPDGQLAQFNCEANFAGEFTSISWSAPGGSPANQSGNKKTFTTSVRNEPGAPVSLKVTATVCNFGVCRTSLPQSVGITRTITTLDSSPAADVNKGHKLTLMAHVAGLPVPGSKAIATTPQGGTVQFLVDGDAIGDSATLFTVGSTAIAQLAVETDELSTSDPPEQGGLPHSFTAVYSGGVNAFGSASDDGDGEPRIITVKPPLPDECDSINNDGNTDLDPELEDTVTDGTCNFAVPKDLGAGTILNSVVITGGEQDGAPNAVILNPGESFSVSGTVGRGDYCPGCFRQLYIGIGGYDPPAGSVDPMPTAVYSGPQCRNLFIPPPASSGGIAYFPFTFTAPTTPGVYYLRATTTLDYFCVGPFVGPPETSVGRIIVRSEIYTQIETWNWNDNCTGAGAVLTAAEQLECVWAPIPGTHSSNTVAGIEEDERLLLRAQLPPGSIGRVEFSTSPGNVLKVNGAVPTARVCPESGEMVVPGTRTFVPCTPWEARVLTDPIDAVPSTTCVTTEINPAPPICVRATFIDPDPLILRNPADITPPIDTKTYDIRTADDPASNTLPLKILAPTEVTVTTDATGATPVKMGEDFTLTAEVKSADSGLGLNGGGGTVQFKVKFATGAPFNIGHPVPVDSTGHASITWRAGINNPLCTPDPCGDFPFTTRDDTDRSLYNNVYAQYTSGGDSLLQNACEGNNGNQEPHCNEANVDIDPAGSTTSISLVSPSGGAIGTSFEVTAVVTSSEFSPVGAHVKFFEDDDELKQVTIQSSHCTAGPLFVCTVPSGTITTGGTNDEIKAAATYDLTAEFGGTAQVDESTSAVTQIVFTKQTPTITVTMPGSQEVATSATIRAVVNGAVPANLPNNGANLLFKHNGATLVGGTQGVTDLGGGVYGALFNVQNLDAGTYNITVEYTGNGFYDGVTSATETQNITTHTPTVTLNSIGTETIGDNLTVSASVSGSGLRSPAGGSISFYLGGVGGTLLATDTSLSGGSASVTVATGDGTSFPTACTPASTACYTNIVAHFNGDETNGNLEAATSSGGGAILTRRASNAAVTAGATTVKGTNLTLNATVVPASSPDSRVTVACTACLQFQLNVGATTPNWVDVGSPVDVTAVSATSSSGSATTSQPTGSGATYFPNSQTYSIRAVYNGGPVNPNYSADTSTAANATVTPPAPSSIVVTGASIVFQSDGTVSAVVTPVDSSDAACSGCLRFKVGATYNGATTFATVGLSNVGGVYRGSASVTAGGTNFANVGTYQVWAEYLGNSAVGPGQSSASADVTVTPKSTTVAINSGNTNGPIGSSQNFGIATTSGIAGTIKLFVDDVEVDSEAVDTDGSSTLEWTANVNAGLVTLHATFTPTSSNFAASTSSDRSFNVQPHTVTMVLRANGNLANGDGDVDVTVGATVTFTATLNFTSTITGTVQFRKNAVNFGSPVAIVNGVATTTWTAEANADYSWDATFTSTHSNYASGATDSITVDTSP